jgi:transposase InsO family protein
VVGLWIARLRVSKVQLDYERLADGQAKRILLRPIEPAGKVLSLRYHSWCRAEAGCELDDQSSCPRVVPTRLTPTEVGAMREMVESDDHRHRSLRGLALHAQRIEKIFASPSTWLRLVRIAGWRRPRNRVYPAKPKIGIRAAAPGELLHLNVTIIQLLEGTRAYLHAVIDNYARRILPWTLENRLGSGGTCQILHEAAVQLINRSGVTTVVADSGTENVNGEVDELLKDEALIRVLAQVEVTFSHSMIEAFWRSLKHAWIYMHNLDNFTALGRLIECYVTAHNKVMPHSAFQGQTPDEMYWGTGGAVPADFASARKTAREEQMEANRAACSVYLGETDSRALLPQRPGCRML